MEELINGNLDEVPRFFPKIFKWEKVDLKVRSENAGVGVGRWATPRLEDLDFYEFAEAEDEGSDGEA
jgi:hypothetical protein